jgi:hypothetical protein
VFPSCSHLSPWLWRHSESLRISLMVPVSGNIRFTMPFRCLTMSVHFRVLPSFRCQPDFTKEELYNVPISNLLKHCNRILRRMDHSLSCWSRMQRIVDERR